MSKRSTVLAGSLALLVILGAGAYWLLQGGGPDGASERGTLAPVADRGVTLPEAAPGAGLLADAASTPEALPLVDGGPTPQGAEAVLAQEHALVFTGRVLDPQRRTVSGARVELLGTVQTNDMQGWARGARPMDLPRLSCDASATTDGEGRFRLAVPESRAFRAVGDTSSSDFPLLRTSAEGLAVDTRTVQAHPDAEADVGDVVLEAGAALRGRVVEQGGRPVADARVSVDHRGDRTQTGPAALAADEAEWAGTAADGSFRLPGLRAGEITLVVEADGRPKLEEDYSVRPGDVRDVGTLVMDADLRLSGTVRDPDGVVAGARLSLSRAGVLPIDVLARTTGDDDGRHYPAELNIDLPQPGAADLLLPDLKHLRVHARDADDRPVTRGEASLHRNSEVLSRAAFGEDGADLPLPAAGTLVVQADGCAPRAVPIKLSDLTAAAGSMQLEREAVVRGHAHDEAGKPLANLVVRAEPWEGPLANLGLMVRGLTDAHGDVELRGLGPGEWTVRADRLGYRTGRFGATLKAGETRDLELRFTGGGRLEGLVRTSRGVICPNVLVSLGSAQGKALQTTFADEAGAFSFGGLSPGETWLTVEGGGGRTPVTIVDGATTHVDVVVPAPAVLSGRVRSGASDVAGVEVALSFGGGNKHHSQSSDERGEFRFEGLLPGLWRVQVRGDDRLVRAATEVTLPEGQEERIDLALSEAHVVAHVRRAEDGAPLSNATVRLKPAEPVPAGPANPWGFGNASGPKSSAKAVTGADGVARFEDVPPGRYALTTEADGRLPAVQVLDVAAGGGELVVTLDTALAARVEGVVFAADDGPLKVRIFVQPLAAGGEPFTGSVVDGHYLVDHLPPGPARVAVQQNLSKDFNKRDDLDLAAQQIELVAGETAQADFTVRPVRSP
jgi:protocatechuate 3,4-dioxygenase beta subunit